MKKNIAVFFGGRSTEHDISIITAVQAMANLNRETCEVFPVYMRAGGFYTGDLFDISAFTPFNPKKCQKIYLLEGVFYNKIKSILVKKFKPECALICCHGGEGENGILQGLLEYNNVPYTGCGVLASAFGMDKAIQKELLKSLMLNVVKFLVFDREDYNKNCKSIIMHLETFLDYPMIVKPNSLGSSIGIKLAYNQSELIEAIEIAKQFDDRIIVETALTDFTEINCAAVFDGCKVVISEVEKPLNWQNFLTFDDKYIKNGKGMENAKRELPAKICENFYNIITSTTEKIYTELNLKGVVRVDYMIDNVTDKVYVNEFNTVPGSLSNYLFDINGISYPELLDYLIEGSIKYAALKQGNKSVFCSGVLKNLKDGKIMKK